MQSHISRLAAALVGMATFASSAEAQTVNLLCSGVEHLYDPDHIEVDVPPSGVRVDFDHRTVTTAMGDVFEIFKEEETSIYFGAKGPDGKLAASGSIDRTSGHMSILVFAQAGSNQAKRADFLNCSVSNRLF